MNHGPWNMIYASGTFNSCQLINANGVPCHGYTDSNGETKTTQEEVGNFIRLTINRYRGKRYWIFESDFWVQHFQIETFFSNWRSFLARSRSGSYSIRLSTERFIAPMPEYQYYCLSSIAYGHVQ